MQRIDQLEKRAAEFETSHTATHTVEGPAPAQPAAQAPRPSMSGHDHDTPEALHWISGFAALKFEYRNQTRFWLSNFNARRMQTIFTF